MASNDQEAARDLILIGTSATWGTILVFSVLSLLNVGSQPTFLDTASKVLLPLFNTTIVALLGYAFGKPVADGVKRYFDRKADTFAQNNTGVSDVTGISQAKRPKAG